jgi:uncharacterized protein
MSTHLMFLMFVAFAAYAQNVTGFALALILLGLIGATDLVPLSDAVNAVTVISLTNAGAFLYRRWPVRFERSLWPAVVSSIPGAIAGTILMTWLATAAYEALRLLLGLSIVLCAVLLWRAGTPLKTVSSRHAFVLAGGMSGLLAGMFAAAGPPLVYLMYRQPLAHTRVQESLIFFFGIASLLRLALTVPAGTFSMHAVTLTAEAIPVVLVVTVMAARRPPPLSERPLKAVVCLLLILTGAGLVGAALSAMATPQPGRSHAAVEGITRLLRDDRPALQPTGHRTRIGPEPAGHRAG